MATTTTTLEVKKNTAKLLEELKHKYETKSADETIRKLIQRAENVPDSMFGAHPDMRRFKATDEAHAHQL
jgi:hypothetical protein